MYKGASQSLQRSNAVGKPHPSRGSIDGASDPSDVLMSPDSMSLEQATSERAQLKQELLQVAQGLSVAKKVGSDREVRHWGQRHAVIQGRLSAVNARIKAFDLASDNRLFSQAVREVLDPEIFSRVVARKNELVAQAIEARRAETLGSVHESAVAMPCAQTDPDQSINSTGGQ